MKTAAVLAVAVAVLAGCSSNESAPTPSGAPTPVKAEVNLGNPVVFTRTSDGKRVGTITIAEAVSVPDECVVDPRASGRQAIAIRMEIVNDGDLMLPWPDIYSVKVQDAGGATQNVETATFRLACTSLYPHIAGSQAPGKTAGWAIFDVAPASAVVYAPPVVDEGSSVDNIRLAGLSPAFAAVKVPVPLPVGARPVAAQPTVEPAPTTQKAPAPRSAPAAGQACTPGTDGWATDTSGGQLKCAYAGGATPKWVQSMPFIGTRTPGSSCELGAAVAESPAGQTLVCIGDRGAATWAPGP